MHLQSALRMVHDPQRALVLSCLINYAKSGKK